VSFRETVLRQVLDVSGQQGVTGLVEDVLVEVPDFRIGSDSDEKRRPALVRIVERRGGYCYGDYNINRDFRNSLAKPADLR